MVARCWRGSQLSMRATMRSQSRSRKNDTIGVMKMSDSRLASAMPPVSTPCSSRADQLAMSADAGAEHVAQPGDVLGREPLLRRIA